MQKSKVSNTELVFKEAQAYINKGISSVQNPGDKCTMVLGMTRSGKSCLINYLLGIKLNADVLDNSGIGKAGRELKIMLANPNQKELGPIIGYSVQSKTTIPRKYQSNQGVFKQSIYDNPGFADNRGVSIDISNATLVSKLLSKAKNIRFVLVVDYHDINGDNTKSFIDLSKQINYLFDIQTIKDHTLIVFTKVEDNYKYEDILKDLNEILNKITDPDFNKNLIKHIISKKRISIFRKPTTKGPISMKDAIQITQNILKINPLANLQKVKVGISPETRNFIYQKNIIILQLAKKDLSQFTKYMNKLIDLPKIKTLEQANLAKQNLIKVIQKQIKINYNDVNLLDFIERVQSVMKKYNVKIQSSLMNSIRCKLYLIDFIKKIIEFKETGVEEFKSDISIQLSQIIHKLINKSLEYQVIEGKIKQQQMEREKIKQQKIINDYASDLKKLNTQIIQKQSEMLLLLQMRNLQNKNNYFQQILNNKQIEIQKLRNLIQQQRNSGGGGFCNLI